MSGTNVPKHVCMPKEGILSIQYDSRLMFRNIYDIVLNTSRTLLLLIFCISQGSVVTCFKVRWEIWHESCCKFSVESSSKKNLKSSNISQSYERISSATFLWLTVYIRHYTTTNFTHNLSNQNLTATDAANAWSCNYVGYMCCGLVSDNKV